MEITLDTIDKIVKIGVEVGAVSALVKTGQIRPYLKKSEAFKIYGRANIEKWFEAGLLAPRQDGPRTAAYRLDRLEIEILSKSADLFALLE